MGSQGSCTDCIKRIIKCIAKIIPVNTQSTHNNKGRAFTVKSFLHQAVTASAPEGKTCPVVFLYVGLEIDINLSNKFLGGFE